MRNVFLKISSLLIVFVLLAFVGFAENNFTDVEGAKYQKSIERLAELGFVQGYDDKSFRPFAPINRAELLKMIFVALDQEPSEKGDCFADVSDQWFAPYVCTAKDLGIISGYSDGTFRPGNYANLAESFKISIEAFGFPFDDSDEGSWYAPYARFVHNNNIFAMGSYFPNANAQRGEIAFLIDNFIELEVSPDLGSAVRVGDSLGCGQVPPASVQQEFVVDGVKREAIVVIPGTYDKGVASPIVFAFHGRTNSNSRVRSYYGLEKAAKGQAIVVYPAGLSNGNSYSWSGVDYEFFDLMLENISSNYCVDMDKVYAMGHSLGAAFVNSLACARGDVLSAVATLGGGRVLNGDCSGPVSVMQWHNPNDRLASFDSGVSARDKFLSQNQCSDQSLAVEPSWGKCVQYAGCAAPSKVLWCPHEEDYDSRGIYYPHNWPKGVGQEMWDFLISN